MSPQSLLIVSVAITNRQGRDSRRHHQIDGNSRTKSFERVASTC